jgi:transposase
MAPNHKLSRNKQSLLSLKTYSHAFSLLSVGVIADETWTLSSPLPPAVIRFLHEEGQSAAEIYSRLCCVYGDTVMSDSCVREWCRKFRNGRTDVEDEGGHGWHSNVTDELVKKIDQCVRGKRRFTISEFSEEFPQTSRTTLYRTVTDRLGCRLDSIICGMSVFHC